MMTLRDRDRWMVGVLADLELSPSSKAVAIRLALHLNLQTGQCNPSYATLAEGTGRQRRSAIDAVAALISQGWVAVERSRGRTSNGFRFLIPDSLTVQPDAPLEPATVHATAPFGAATVQSYAPLTVQSGALLEANGAVSRTPTVQILVPQRCSPVHPNNVLNREENREEDISLPLDVPALRQDGFTEFYQAFPKHKGKGAAQKAYNRAIQKREATPQEIIAGAQRYAVERAGQDPPFTKHPATWLNGGCWEDEPAPSHLHGPAQFSPAARGALSYALEDGDDP